MQAVKRTVTLGDTVRGAVTQRLRMQLRREHPLAGNPAHTRMAQAADLVVAGYSTSRVGALNKAAARFVEFCHEDGFDEDSAGEGPAAMLAYLAHLAADTTVTAQTATQYVSSINIAYEMAGLSPPGRAANSSRLYADVKRALAGFRNARVAQGQIPTGPTPATPPLLALRMCRLVEQYLEAGKLVAARGLLAHVFQYFMMTRPKMAVMTTWTCLALSPESLEFTVSKGAIGR